MTRAFYDNVLKFLLRDPILSLSNPDHNPTHHDFMIHCNIILCSMPVSTKLISSFRFSNYNFVWNSILTHACYISHHLTLLYIITKLIYDERYKLSSFTLCIFSIVFSLSLNQCSKLVQKLVNSFIFPGEIKECLVFLTLYFCILKQNCYHRKSGEYRTVQINT